MCSRILFIDDTVAFRIVRVCEDAIWIKKNPAVLKITCF